MESHTARKALLVCLVIEACRASIEIEVLRVSLTIVALELAQHSTPWRASPGYCALITNTAIGAWKVYKASEACISSTDIEASNNDTQLE